MTDIKMVTESIPITHHSIIYELPWVIAPLTLTCNLYNCSTNNTILHWSLSAAEIWFQIIHVIIIFSSKILSIENKR